MKFRLALATAMVLCAAQPAAAQTVSAANPQSIVQALQSAGYRAALGRDQNGDPQIQTGVGGSNFIVYFFDCTNGRACRAIQFHSSYEMDSPPPLARMNEWNRGQRYARGFITEANNPAMEMDVNLDAPGGMSRALFLDNLDLFTILLPQFERLIGWQR